MNLIKVLGIGAISLLAVGGWRFINNFRKQSKLPSKQQTLAILQKIRQQFYPLLVKIADYVARELIPKGINPQDNEKYVLANAAFKAEIQALNQKIYDKYSEEQVQQATETLYKDDGDILKQRHQFKQEYKKALLGIRPQKQMIASRKISKTKVLQVIKDLLQDKIGRLETLKVKEMQPNQQRIILQGDVQQDERVTKEKIKEKLGLSAKDSIDIFHYTVSRYSQQDEHFKTQYDQIANNYSVKVRQMIPQ